jgi:aminopeptidase N
MRCHKQTRKSRPMMKTDTAPLIRLEDYLPADFLIETVDLDIKLHPEKTHVRALLTVVSNPNGQSGVPLTLDGDELTLKSIALNGRKLAATEYAMDGSRLIIPSVPRERFTLTIITELNPTANTKLMGLYRSNGIYCTQCEADGFRRITWFIDRPDVMSIYTMRIEAERIEASILLGNGNLVAKGDLPGTTRHFAIWHDPHPKPAYLFALVAGNLDALKQDYMTADGHQVELAIWVEKGKRERALWAMDSLVRCMRWDEKVFGRNYDLDVFNVVAVSHFNMGAMENKGLNIFNDKYVLADAQTATDADYANIEAIIAHEYFHNWTGNRITCRDWFQLCLKEGLTVFRDQEFSSDERSRPVKRIADVRTLRTSQFAEDAGPLAHAVRPRAYKEINNFYTPTVYEKGAELIRMLKLLIGDGAFHDGMDLYFTRCDGTAATIEDFLACFEDVSGKDLKHFALWYEQAGTPVIVASGRHDSMREIYRLDLSQTTKPTPGQSTKQPMVVPIVIGLVGPSGDLPLNLEDGSEFGGLAVLSEGSMSLTFTHIKARPVPSLLRGFSAPVRIEMDLSDDDLLTLFARDSDPFNRWQSAQTVALRAMVRATEAIRDGGPASFPSILIETLGRFLDADARRDPAFAAQVLSLPTEGDIAREIAVNVDPDAIMAARNALRSSISRSLNDVLRRLHTDLTIAEPYQPDAASAGKRALRNETLSMIVAGGSGFDLASEAFMRSDNLTDRIAALTAICREPSEDREVALVNFEQRYSVEPLVLDKWFAIQAGIPEATTLDRVKKLMSHPSFDMTNPNRARALIGAFTANTSQFHGADGAGYDFVAELVLQLDRQNPQIAARIMGAFKTWRMMEPVRMAHAKTALIRVGAHSGLSRDLADIIERALA